MKQLLLNLGLLLALLSAFGCKKIVDNKVLVRDAVSAAKAYRDSGSKDDLEKLESTFNALERQGMLADLAAYRDDDQGGASTSPSVRRDESNVQSAALVGQQVAPQSSSNGYGNILAASKATSEVVDIARRFVKEPAAKEQVSSCVDTLWTGSRSPDEEKSHLMEFLAVLVTSEPKSINRIEKNGDFKITSAIDIMNKIDDESNLYDVYAAMTDSNRKTFRKKAASSPSLVTKIMPSLEERMPTSEKNDYRNLQIANSSPPPPPPPPPPQQIIYDAEGFAPDGYNIAGYNRQGIDRNGIHFSGHIFLPGVRIIAANGTITINNDTGIYPLDYDFTEIVNVAGIDQNFQVSRGFDQQGFHRPLPNGLIGKDETFDRNGYNGTTYENYLGLTKAQFDAKGVEAILDKPQVAAYPNDIDQMRIRFNNSCYKLKFNDNIMGNGVVDWGVVVPNLYDPANNPGDDIVVSPLLDNFFAYHLPPQDANDEKYFPMTKVLRNDHDAIRSKDEIKANILKHLKMATYFCEEFLYAGIGANAIPRHRDFSKLRVSTSYMTTDLYVSLDLLNYLQVLQTPHRGRPSLDFITTIKDRLSNDILDKATYSELNDRVNYGTRGAAGGPPSRVAPDGQRNLGVRQHNVNETLDVYTNNPVFKGKDYDKSRIYLRLVADKINDDTALREAMQRKFPGLPLQNYDPHDALIKIASDLAHGGVHCPDAKRKAVLGIATFLDPEGIDKLNKLPGLVFGNGNLSILAKRALYLNKLDRYEKWILKIIGLRNIGEVLSTLAGTWYWNRLSFGMPAVDVEYPYFGIKAQPAGAPANNRYLDTSKFFGHDYVLPVLGANPEQVAVPLIPGAGYTPNAGFSTYNIYQLIQKHMQKYPTPLEPADQLQMIRNDIFGPLWFLYGDENSKLIGKNASGNNLQISEHPILMDLLVRLGVFTKTP